MGVAANNACLRVVVVLALGLCVFGACDGGRSGAPHTEDLLFACAATRASKADINLLRRLDSAEALLIEVGAMPDGSPSAYRGLLGALHDDRVPDIGAVGIERNDPRLGLAGFVAARVDCARGLQPDDSVRLVGAILDLAEAQAKRIEAATVSGEIPSDFYYASALGDPEAFEDYSSNWVRLRILAAFGQAARSRYDRLRSRMPSWAE